MVYYPREKSRLSAMATLVHCELWLPLPAKITTTVTTKPTNPTKRALRITKPYPSRIICMPRTPTRGPILRTRCTTTLNADSPSQSKNEEESELEFEDGESEIEEEEEVVGALEDEPMACDGAIIFKRSTVQTHYEYFTSLERLDLAFLSSELSKARASSTGLMLAGDGNDNDTPLQVSIDVFRKKSGDLELRGLVRTFLSLPCRRCGDEAVERVFSNFCLILTDKPVEETIEGIISLDFGGKKANINSAFDEEEEEDEETFDIFSDDRMHFPRGSKEIDLSKYIYDLVHVQYAVEAICDIDCKGICNKCGNNLNKATCNCNPQNEAKSSPFDVLKKQKQNM